MVRSGVLACAALLAASAARGQEIRRLQPRAFPAQVAVSLGLGFGGQRASAAAGQGLCTGSGACRFKLGSGPLIGLDFQVPVTATLGFGVSGAGGRIPRVTCGAECNSSDKATVIHASALLLWRFKARAPIYFGVGATLSWISPGPVLQWDTTAVKEPGGVLVVGYDFGITPTVGGRLAWWNYLTKPTPDNLPTLLTADGLAWDKVFSLGVRLGLHK
jgi:hypothetical protein